MKRRLKKIVIALAVFYPFIVGGMFLIQEKLIFLPSELPLDHEYSFDIPFEELWLTHPDGAQLNALHFKSENPKGIVLYFHGNSGDLDRWGSIAGSFTKFNYDVLVMDYRTYGKSSGNLGEKPMYEDAALFYKKAAELFPEDQIIVYGRSLGTTFATFVASENKPGKLLLETPFYSLSSLVKDRYWFVPVNTLLRYKFPTNKYILEVNCPIVIFHGTEDGIVPYKHGVQLHETLPKSQSKLLTIEGGSHNNLIDFEIYRAAIQHEMTQP
ncbi:MAG: alpha/beta hydrolase [Flavobacteriaceae bacterium]|nr:alpha/beta hydrolase [Flavobacteriaceae bacterium]